jgi:hypothetical protein
LIIDECTNVEYSILNKWLRDNPDEKKNQDSSTYIKIRKTRQQYIHKDKENKTAVHT